MHHLLYTFPFATAVKAPFTGFKVTGNFTTLDLIAASTNSLNGALLARRPDHYRNWTIVGIILCALLMGLGGGITRDVLVNDIPAALTNPAYIIFSLAFGTVGYFLAYGKGQLFREGLFQFMISFSLPFYAIVGAQKGVAVGLPILGVLALAVLSPTVGRLYVDVCSGVPPKQFIKGEWFVGTALLTGAIWLACDALKFGTWVCLRGEPEEPRDVGRDRLSHYGASETGACFSPAVAVPSPPFSTSRPRSCISRADLPLSLRPSQTKCSLRLLHLHPAEPARRNATSSTLAPASSARDAAACRKECIDGSEPRGAITGRRSSSTVQSEEGWLTIVS
jgi:uncharacterized membrane protein YeiH